VFGHISSYKYYKVVLYFVISILIFSGVLLYLSYERSRTIYFSQINTFQDLSELKFSLYQDQIATLVKKFHDGKKLDLNGTIEREVYKAVQSFSQYDYLTNSYIDIPTSTMRGKDRFTHAIVVGETLLKQNVTFGYEYIMRPQLWKARDLAEQGEAAISDVYVDAYGKWLTIFVPIKDEDGNILAIHGLDLNVNIIEDNLRQQLLLDIVLVFLLIVLGTACLIFVLNRIRVEEKKKLQE